jgi:hypothetical protein
MIRTSATPFGEAVNREPVAEQVVALLVGSIGLIAAVPLTPAVAAALAAALPATAMPAATPRARALTRTLAQEEHQAGAA